jgi:hypothetical protein
MRTGRRSRGGGWSSALDAAARGKLSLVSAADHLLGLAAVAMMIVGGLGRIRGRSAAPVPGEAGR